MEAVATPIGPWLPRGRGAASAGRSRFVSGAVAASLLVHATLFVVTALSPQVLRTPPEIEVREATPVEVVVDSADMGARTALAGASLPLEALQPSAGAAQSAPPAIPAEALAADAPPSPVTPLVEAATQAAPAAPSPPAAQAEPAADIPAAPTPSPSLPSAAVQITGLPPPLTEEPSASPIAAADASTSLASPAESAPPLAMGPEPVAIAAEAPGPATAALAGLAPPAVAVGPPPGSTAAPIENAILEPGVVRDIPEDNPIVQEVPSPAAAPADVAAPAIAPLPALAAPEQAGAAAATLDPAVAPGEAAGPAARDPAPTVLALAAPPRSLAPSDPREGVEAAIGSLDCARVSASVDLLAGRVVLAGHVRSGEDRDRIAARIAALPGIRSVETEGLGLVGEPYCRVLSLLARPEFQKSTEQRGDLVAVGAANASASRRAVGGDTLPLTLSAPEFDAYLYVDHFSADGRVLHLLPTDRPDNRFKADTVFRLGSASPIGRKAVIGPPYGLDVVLVVASSEPLFVRPRNASEEAAGYLAALDERLQVLRARGFKPRIEYAYYLVTTSPPPPGGH